MDRTELRAALGSGMIETRYQPIVRLDDGGVIGVEVLARLNHPTRGTVPPDRFVPQIEDAGLAAELADCVAASAFADMGSMAIAPLGLMVGLNLPLEVLLVPAALERLDVRRREACVPAERVVIELTESQPVVDVAGLRHAMGQVRQAGYRAVIDDAAPSVPQVKELMNLPFSGVKLDRALVGEIDTRAESRSFVASVIASARARAMTVTVEGVEDFADWQRAQEIGAHRAQGFLVAHPLRASALPDWLTRWNELRVI